MLVPSRAAVYELDPATLDAELWLHHPLMTDVHSVASGPGHGVLVSSTGIDAVLEFQPENGNPGAHVTRHELGDPHRLGDRVDFTGVPYADLKPHVVHPNHASFRAGEIWVTRFEDRCARSLSGRQIPLPEGPPHDGHLRDGLVWHTTVTGHIVAVDPVTLERAEHHDLNQIVNSPRMLGWCRGIEVVQDRIYVGMTQLRDSRHREALRRLVRGDAGRRLPTRIIELERGTGRLLREFPLGNQAGGTVHGLLALNPGG